MSLYERHENATSTNKMSLKQLSVIFLLVAAFGIAAAVFVGLPQQGEIAELRDAWPTPFIADQERRHLLRP